MWYLAEILFAKPKQDNRRMYFCESCDVLFEATSANEAYQKAENWGQNYVADASGRIELLGISDLTIVGETLCDGTEICGRYFQKLDVWERKDDLIPAPEELKAILWEGNQDTPVVKMLDSSQLKLLKERFENSD